MFFVNDNVWHILFVHPSSRYLQRSNGTYTLGVTDINNRIVYINNRLKGYMLDKVLCHELCHVYMFEYGVDVDLDTEELIADFIASYGREIFTLADEILGNVFQKFQSE